MELKLLKAIAVNREYYDKIKGLVAEGDFTQQARILFDAFQTFYDSDKDSGNVDLDLVLRKLERELDNPKHFEMFKSLVSSFPKDVSAPNIVKDFIETKKHNTGLKLSQSIQMGEEKETRKLIDDYLLYMDAENLDEDVTKEVFQDVSVETLNEKFSPETLIPLWPNSLASRLGGGVRRGHHTIIFARPETGKTALALNLARRPCKEGRTGIYFGNEDNMMDVIRRAKSAFSGMTWDECLANPKLADSNANDNGFGNFVFIGLYPGSVAEVREIVHERRPDFYIVDQITNFNAKADNYTLQLGSISRGMRNIAKRYNCAAFSFIQAGDSADGKLVLDMGDINWSNTDVQATADLMIGIGMDKEFESKNWRMFSLCKNKITGSHDYFATELDIKLNRFKSV